MKFTRTYAALAVVLTLLLAAPVYGDAAAVETITLPPGVAQEIIQPTPSRLSMPLPPGAVASTSASASASIPGGSTFTVKAEANDLLADILTGILSILGTALLWAVKAGIGYLKAKSNLAVVQTGLTALEEAANEAVGQVWEEKSKYLVEQVRKGEIQPGDYKRLMHEAGSEAVNLTRRIGGKTLENLKPQMGDVEALVRAKLTRKAAELKADAIALFSTGK